MTTSATTAAPATSSSHRLPLGRSGALEQPAEVLLRKIKHLDALLLLVGGTGETEEDGMISFQRFNPFIQNAVLDLASTLAEEAHEIADRMVCAEVTK